MESNRVGGIAGTAFQTVHEEHNEAREAPNRAGATVIESADEVLVYISKSCYRGIGVYQRNPYDREERQRVDGAVQYCSPPICGMRCC